MQIGTWAFKALGVSSGGRLLRYPARRIGRGVRRFLLACILALAGFHSQPATAQRSTVAPTQGSPVSQVARIAFNVFYTAAPDDRYRQDWLGAIQLVALDERKRARPLLEDLVTSERFEELRPTERHAGLLLAGMVSLTELDFEYAHRLFVRSSAMPQAILGDWSGRFVAANRLGDRVDALVSVTELLRRWPDDWGNINLDTLIPNIVSDPVGEQREAQFQALNALFEVGFQERGTEPSAWWGLLAAELTERGDLERAALVAARIDMPRTLIAMRIDRRFDVLVRRAPQIFDVKTAARKQVVEFEASVQNYPDSLMAITQLEEAYYTAGQFAETLRLGDSVQARVATGGKASFNALTLAHSNQLRALALDALQRASDAESQYRNSAHEDGNVAGVLDLAEFYVNRNRAKEALDVLSSLPADEHGLSPHGSAQARLIRLTAALSLHDQDEVRRCLGYLRAHQSDGPSLLQLALIRANETNEATQLIITRLKDARLRTQALAQVQTYVLPVDPPVIHETNARWARILELPAVKVAINAVGRRERFEVVQW